MDHLLLELDEPSKFGLNIRHRRQPWKLLQDLETLSLVDSPGSDNHEGLYALLRTICAIHVAFLVGDPTTNPYIFGLLGISLFFIELSLRSLVELRYEKLLLRVGRIRILCTHNMPLTTQRLAAWCSRHQVDVGGVLGGIPRMPPCEVFLSVLGGRHAQTQALA